MSTEIEPQGAARSYTDRPGVVDDDRGRRDPLDWPDLEGLESCDAAALRQRVSRVGRWFHTMDLGRGVRTPGIYDPATRLHRIGLPERLDGKSVLDIGAWDGFYSFECARRGASVTSMDIWKPGHNESSEGYAVARAALGLETRAVRSSVFELSPETHGAHDIVLFLGVLYHLEDPLGAVRRLRAVTRERLILETECDLAHVRRPAAAFYPRGELGMDTTNWFGPNEAAVVGMLRAAGFGRVRVAWSMSQGVRAVRALRRWRKFGENPISGLSRGRLVVHAEP
ncbi:MAG: DUF1698 domain-containing protein [Phycisphaerales bacterium]|nr:DUF1698 domain-containing protein [Phycisphaerales bacterium]